MCGVFQRARSLHPIGEAGGLHHPLLGQVHLLLQLQHHNVVDKGEVVVAGVHGHFPHLKSSLLGLSQNNFFLHKLYTVPKIIYVSACHGC